MATTTVDYTSTLDAGRSGLLEGDLTDGTYAITCMQLDTADSRVCSRSAPSR